MPVITTAAPTRLTRVFAGTGVLLLIVLAVAARTSGPLHSLDLTVTNGLNRSGASNHLWISCWKTITTIGGPAVWEVLGVVAAVVLLVRRRSSEAAVVVLGIGAASIASTLLKLVVARPRPQVGTVVAQASGNSFPSGHSTVAAAGCVVVFLLLGPRLARTARTVLAIVLIAVAALVGFSRLALGVHYITDVVAGWLLAVLVTATVAHLFMRDRKPPG